MPELRSDTDIARVLRDARTIAVLGAHEDTGRAAFYVPDYLAEQGYRVVPVNPKMVGKVLWGEPVRRSLLDLAGLKVDIVDVFRRSSALPHHLPEWLSMSPRPRLVWFQLGIRNDSVAADLLAAGIEVVQDRCTLADHRRLNIPSAGAT